MDILTMTHTLAAHGERLLALQEGDELLCTKGRVQLRSAGMSNAAWASDAGGGWTLPTTRQWRVPCAMVVTLSAGDQPASVLARGMRTDAAATQKSRPDPWGRRLWQSGWAALRFLTSGAL